MRQGEQACDLCKKARREESKARYRGEITPRTPRKRKREEEKRIATEVVAAVAEVRARDEKDDGVYPAFLKDRGRKLWDEVTGAYDLEPAALTVLAECCRMADRAERFSAALASKHTFWFEVDGMDQADEAGVPVVVNSMIAEARQMTVGIRQGLNSIGVLKPGKAKSTEGGIFDELQKRRAKRVAGEGS